MSSRTLPLLLAVLVLGLGVAWIATRTEPAPDPTRSAASRDAIEAPARSEDAVELAPPEASAKADAAPAASRSTAPAPKPGTLPADVVWVEGRVVFPAGTPRDERVVVVAGGKKIGDASEQRADVDAQGHFAIAFAAGTTKGTLDVEARYLYLRQRLELDPTKAGADLVLEPELGGLLRLRLVPSALAERRGADLTKARAQAWPDSERGEQRTRFASFDAGAVAELGGLASGVSWYPSVTLAGFSADSTTRVAPMPGEVIALDVPLTAAPRLAGVVRDQRGAPIAGASIRVELRKADSHTSHGSNVSGNDGRFEVYVDGSGTATVRAERPGFLAASADPTEVAEGFERDDLALVLGDGLSIEGVVRWPDGSPAGDASLALHTGQSRSEMFGAGQAEQSLRTNDDGTFRLTGLEARTYTIAARVRRARSAEAKSERVWWTARRDALEPGARDVVLVLAVGSTLRGRVVDDLGQPSAAAQVRAEPTGAGVAGRAAVTARVASDTGAFELAAVPDGEWSVHARGRGGSESPRAVVVLPRDAQRAVDLALPRAASIAGRVVDFDGTPAAGATVLLFVRGEQHGDSNEAETTDAEGKFRFDAVRVASWSISAQRNGRASALPRTLELTAGGAVDGVELALRRGGTIEGRLLDDQDAPRAGIEVRAFHTGGRGSEARTGADGAFRMEAVEPGTVQLFAPSALPSADVGGFGLSRDDVRASVTVEDGATVRVELGGAPRGRIAISGRVTAKGPVADAQLSFWALEAPDGTNDRERSARTDDAGRYEARVPHPGMYYARVEARGFGSVERRIDVKDAEGQTFDFEFGAGRLAGRVVGPDGRALAQAHVFVGALDGVAHDATATSGMGPTKSDGTFEFGGLMPGRYRIEVSPPWRPNAEQLASGRIEVALAPGEQRSDLEIRLERGCAVAVRVTGSDGRPAANAHVGWSADGRGHMSSTTDASGFARLEGLPPGTVSITARTQMETEREPARVVARADATEEVAITLVPGGRLVVRLERRDGSAIAQPWMHPIQVTDAGGLAVEASYDDLGEARMQFGPLRPGAYHVLAHFAKMRAETDVTVTAGGEREVVLREPQ